MYKTIQKELQKKGLKYPKYFAKMINFGIIYGHKKEEINEKSKTIV